jgi:O-antigen ligase
MCVVLAFSALLAFLRDIACTQLRADLNTQSSPLQRVLRYRLLLSSSLSGQARAGGMLAVISGTIFAFFFAPVLRRSIAGFFGSALILAVLASYALPIVNENYGLKRMISSSSIIVDGGNPSAGRTQIWAGTVQKIMERPVLGWGIEQFAISGPEETLGFKQPHNMILQILFSVGFLGGLATLMMLLPIALRVVFDLSQPERVAAWGYVTGAIAFGLYDAAFYYTYPVMIFLIAAATILTPEKPSVAPDRSS